MLEIDGDNVEPHNVEPVMLLSIAAAYIELMQEASRAIDAPLALSGVEVVNKCVAVKTRVSNEDSARMAAEEVNSLLASGRQAPLGARLVLERLQASLRRLPASYRILARTCVAGWTQPVPLKCVPRGEVEAEVVTLRATPIRAGGLHPAIRFESDSEDTDFTLAGSREQVRELAAHLYREVDVTAEVIRDGDGKIASGEILDFEAVSEVGEIEAWQRWFKEAGGEEWETETDVEHALGRHRAHH